MKNLSALFFTTILLFLNLNLLNALRIAQSNDSILSQNNVVDKSTQITGGQIPKLEVSDPNSGNLNNTTNQTNVINPETSLSPATSIQNTTDSSNSGATSVQNATDSSNSSATQSSQNSGDSYLSNDTKSSKDSGDSNNTSPLVPSQNSTDVNNTIKDVISEMCNELVVLQNALADLQLETEVLKTQFRKHTALYKKWELDASTQQDKDILIKKEELYLNSYLDTAMKLDDLITGLNAQLESYEKANCMKKTFVIDADKGEPIPNNGPVQQDTSLIQMILNRFDELGLKIDPRLSKLVEMKTSNKKTNLRKKNIKF